MSQQRQSILKPRPCEVPRQSFNPESATTPTTPATQVYIQMNSSIIHDEVLAHRLGLVPIKVDPRQFQGQWLGPIIGPV